MFGASYQIAKVWGIPIKVDVSLIVLLVMLSLDFGPWNGFLLAIGLLTSIVLHELGHSVVAIRKGCRVRQITLMFIGGAAQMERIPTRPLDEFLMAIAGPAVSLCLGFAGVWLGPFLPLPRDFPLKMNLIEWLGVVNFALVVFNLLPSFPMDGGRVLRAVLTPKLGRLRATFIAARIGRIMAVFFGVYGFLPPRSWILVVIAFFLYITAGNEYRMVQAQEAAKRFGGSGWPPPFAPTEDPEESTGDKVIVSPPPYKKGPSSETDLYTEDDPFRR